MAALATGGGSSLINAQAWSGEITWDLLLGTNTLRNLHFNAPLSVSLQNDNFTLSLACDSYSIAQADAAIAAALVPYETAAQRDAAIAAALTAYSTTTETSAAIAAALLQYYTATQVDTQIASAVAGIDLTPYYTSTQTDAAITAALVPVTLSNAPAWGANPPTWELLKGSNVLRNLHFAGPLLASLQNNTDTLQLECDAYSKAETFVNSVVAGAIDALNVTQYRTEAQVSTAISDALAPYYTAAEVDAEIAANGFDGSQYYTRTQSDSRYFLQNASPGNVSLVRDNVTPPQVRGLVPRSPLGSSVLFSGTVLELTCDAYTKSEADGRYVQSGNLGSLDSRYFPVNGNNGGGGIFPMVITTLTPRMIRAILPRAPLSGALILGNAGTLELNCDCYSTSQGPVRRRLRAPRRAGGTAGEHQRHRRPGLAGHRAGGQRRRARGHQLHQPHGQQLREHAEFHGHGEHHGRRCAVHAGRADAAAEAGERGGQPPENRRRASEHQTGRQRRRHSAGPIQRPGGSHAGAHPVRPAAHNRRRLRPG